VTVLVRNAFIISILWVLLLLLPITFLWFKHSESYYVFGTKAITTVKLANTTLNLIIANTENERQHGLSNSPSLPNNGGMIFVFREPNLACFWMKDMRFNLDILWFNTNNQLMYYKANLSPKSYPHSYCSNEAANYVVELKSGSIQRLGLKIGSSITVQNL